MTFGSNPSSASLWAFWSWEVIDFGLSASGEVKHLDDKRGMNFFKLVFIGI